jgi:ABC-type transport system substrate-binding protein
MTSKAFFSALVASLLLGATCAADANYSVHCKRLTLDFIIKADDPEVAAVEDDIVKDLARIGITVNTRKLNSSAYIKAELEGDYHMMFTRTWGAPYDPHSYLNSWGVPAHVEYSAVGELEPPLTRPILLKKISDVQVKTDPLQIAKGWEEILNDVHQQAIFLPLWGTRVPFVLNRRFAAFTPSTQTYEYRLNTVQILDKDRPGWANVTVAPGAGGSLFTSIGPVNPHQYFPNQLFAQAWVYEGLVGYGQDGEIRPVLATSWTIESIQSGGSRYTFTLRDNVKFHDGSEWNCSVAKLNFDHVLSDTVKARHQWYGATSQLKSWTCSAGRFVLETKAKYYPLLQELTYIRPLTFAAASAFSRGLDSHPDLHNSCNSGDFGSKWAHLEDKITCAGLKPIGTGPFKVVSGHNSKGGIAEAVFARHDDYWGVRPEIQFMHLKYYKNTDDVMADLLSGKLDMALGIGPLTAAQVQKLKFYNSDKLDVRHSDVMQHALMIMNANASFTKDINIRRAIIHAIDKARFIEEEFAGLEQPVTQLLPYSAPYCNVDLSPKWAYDFDKAKRLNCPIPDPGKDGGLPGWATIVIIVISVALAAVLAFALVMYARERQGRPVFMPIDPEEETLVAKPEQGPEGPPPSQALIGHTSPYPMAPAMNPHGFSVA